MPNILMKEKLHFCIQSLAALLLAMTVLNAGTDRCLAQSGSEGVLGDWLCEIDSGKSNPKYMSMLEEDVVKMRDTDENDQPIDRAAHEGTWRIDDEDIDRNGRTVITLSIKWRDSQNTKVVAVFTDDDTMEVTWGKENSRIWKRAVKDNDN